MPRKQQPLLDDFRAALLTGSSARARSLSESITDREAREEVLAEVAEQFRIVAEPVQLRVCPEMPIDLFENQSRFKHAGSYGSRVFLQEGEEAMVVLDLERTTAVRYKSANFKGLMLIDAFPDSGDYLFFDTGGRVMCWRARLREAEASFTAAINFSEQLGIVKEDLSGVVMSESSDTEYVCSVKGRKGTGSARVLKCNLADKCSVVQKNDLPGVGKLHTIRFSSAPERFVVFTDRSIRIINKNLSTTKASGTAAVCYGVDLEAEEFYVLIDQAYLYTLDFDLRPRKCFKNGVGAPFLSLMRVLGVSRSTQTIMVKLDEKRAMLYNLENNRFSNTFSHNNIFGTAEQRPWYYFQYHQATGEIRIRNVTGELENLFE